MTVVVVEDADDAMTTEQHDASCSMDDAAGDVVALVEVVVDVVVVAPAAAAAAAKVFVDVHDAAGVDGDELDAPLDDDHTMVNENMAQIHAHLQQVNLLLWNCRIIKNANGPAKNWRNDANWHDALPDCAQFQVQKVCFDWTPMHWHLQQHRYVLMVVAEYVHKDVPKSLRLANCVLLV